MKPSETLPVNEFTTSKTHPLLRKIAALALSTATLCGVNNAAAAIDPALDWPAWRGPTANGIAAKGQNLPVQWSETNNVVWKAPIPGRGHGSPTVAGDKIFLATADQTTGSQSVICLARDTGKQLWITEVHATGADPGKHANSSAASSTVASDGEKIYINFLNNGAVHTTALTPDGKVVWQKKFSDFVTHQGYAGSPMIYQDLVLVSADHRGGGAIAGLDRKTGEIKWSVPRPNLPNYTSPSVLQAGGKTQMVMSGCNLLTSLDPLTGQKFWEIQGSTEETVGSAVTDGERIFVSGGWPKNHTMSVVADGSGKVAWQNNARVYVPTMIVKDKHLFAVMDAGMAVCWKSDTGQEVWKERLGGDFYASPVMVDNRIYAINLNGAGYVFEATPEKFQLISKNQLGDQAYASPAICDNKIYFRVAKTGDTRQEYLYCIGNAKLQALR